jgi:phosphoglycerol transferase MdoB-like AlkP superfamily enzyme
MKERLLFILRFFLYWMFLFTLSRILFMVWYARQTAELPADDWIKIMLHGIKLDLSTASYFLLFPALVMLITTFFSNRFSELLLTGYCYLLIVISGLIIAVDLELYANWGFRLDATPLLYADHPKEMLANVEFWVLIRQILIALVWIGLAVALYRKYVVPALQVIKSAHWLNIPVFLLVIPALVIPIRGGFGQAPINVGSVYFHKNPFANHAAVNVVYNLGYALIDLKPAGNPYTVVEKQAATSVRNGFYPATPPSPIIIKRDDPNILIIILESFTAKAVGILGGNPDATPNIDRLAKEGLLFTNFYSNGSRSDRGIASILSAYPGLPTVSIITYPRKTPRMESLCKDFSVRGYSSAFYYGGDINFASLRSYLTDIGFEKIIDIEDFPLSQRNSKWGVHDGFVFDKLYEDLESMKQPFFTSFFTLSSHEPFEVPMQTVIAGNQAPSKFLNSMCYTDSCLGAFIDRAKKTAWWANTLVILVADHGSRHPGYDETDNPHRYHIPMVWTGGALLTKGVLNNKYATQTDIAKTLLSQLGMEEGKYVYSKDALSDASRSFGFFIYNDGFGYVSDSASFSFDNRSKLVTFSKGTITDTLVLQARAYQQSVYQSFLDY